MPGPEMVRWWAIQILSQGSAVLPELPEVENMAAGLRERIVGKRIERVEVRRPAMIKGPHRRRWRRFLADLAGDEVARVTRRAKRLIVTSDRGLTLLFQLGMTGKFLLERAWTARPDEVVGNHTHVVIHLQGGPDVQLIDTRRFGRLWLLDALDPDDPDPTMEAAGMGRLGPEALDMGITAFRRLLQANRPIKSLLLDQSRIAGLGNIYADESLFAAGVHPTRPCRHIGDDDTQRLLRRIKSVLRRAIRAGGTTFSDYRNPYGDMGRFRRRLKVYQRQGQPCPVCDRPIEKTVVAGRGTHFCRQCQGSVTE